MAYGDVKSAIMATLPSSRKKEWVSGYEILARNPNIPKNHVYPTLRYLATISGEVLRRRSEKSGRYEYAVAPKGD